MKITIRKTLWATLWAVASCSPNSKYNSSSEADHSKEVEARWAGNSSDSDSRAPDSSGRINLSCFTKSIDLSAVIGKDGVIKSVDIPSNCPKSSSGGEKQNKRFDVAVVLDVSWNMLEKNAAVKRELASVLNKMNADKSIASLTGIAFKNKVVESEASSDIKQTIDLIAGSDPEWSAEALKEIDPNRTDWIDNDATKKILTATYKATLKLKSSSMPDKMLLLISNSIEKNKKLFSSLADELRKLSEVAEEKGGQFIFNYASSAHLAQGLGEFDKSPIEQLDLLVSSAGISPVRAELGDSLGSWAEKTIARSATPSTTSEACIFSKLEGFDAADAPIFQKELNVNEKSGVQNTTLPEILQGTSFKLIITRQCKKTGLSTQTVMVKSKKESPKK